MVTAHVYEDGNGVWVCTDWPTQEITVSGHADRDAAKTAFVSEYNTARGTTLTAGDFRWIGPLLLTVDVSQDGAGWRAVAYAEREYTVTAATEAETKTAFLAMWNAEHGTSLTDENVDWT